MSNLAKLVDDYGTLCAAISDLEIKKSALRQSILDVGRGAYEGQAYRVTVSISERATIDYKTICAKLEPSHQLVSAHTKVAEVSTVKVSGRSGANLKIAA